MPIISFTKGTAAGLLLVAAMAVTACNRPLSQLERNKVKADVQEMLYRYNDEIRARGLQAEFDFIDNSGDFFWVPPGASAPLSLDSVLAAISRNAAQYRVVNNSFDTLAVIPLTKDMAIYTARIRSATTTVSGRDTLLFLMETGTVIHRADGWKLLYGQTAICPAPAE